MFASDATFELWANLFFTTIVRRRLIFHQLIDVRCKAA